MTRCPTQKKLAKMLAELFWSLSLAGRELRDNGEEENIENNWKILFPTNILL